MTQTTGAGTEGGVSRVEEEVAVGEDLDFQRKWWRFENAIWWFFALILALDVAGAFGRGPLAKAERRAADNSLDVKYERIERTGTPSTLTITFGQSAVHQGQIKLFVSESVIKKLGTQRVIPAPATTEVGNGGYLYTFPVLGQPAEVELALQPTGPGRFHFAMQVQGGSPIEGGVVVMP